MGSEMCIRDSNKHVIDDLTKKGAVFLKNIEDAPKDRPIIFSAHGVSKKITNYAKDNNKTIIDATCPLVTKVHVQADKFFKLGFKIILIGHKNHPEVEGTMGQLPQDAIYLVETINDINELNFSGNDKIAYFCLLYTSPSPRDLSTSRMPSSA